MPTLDEIKEQIKHLDNMSRILGFREIKVLPDILWEDEVLERVVQGLYNNSIGILCATNKRLVFVDKGLIYGLRVEDFPHDKITSIQYETGLVFGKITIFASGNKVDIRQIEKKQAKEFGDYVRARITGKSKHASISEEKTIPISMTMEEKLSALERLAKLKEQGILSETELQAEKAKIMGG